MTVYVDDARISYGRMKMSHMIADTLDELHEMAQKVGMKRKWFQDAGRIPHYDVSISRRRLAIHNGAREVSKKELIKITKKCDYVCGYQEPYGFVPECGCPIHDCEEI